ncbi:MAG: hypothetical protein PHF47_02100 [Bacilli bacterium]|nr:hypothetical protein [Bacilli bacterium]
MKKAILLIIITIISFFLSKGMVMAEEVRYDIHSLVATEKKIIIEGWAFLRFTNHGNGYNTRHTLIFDKVYGTGGKQRITVGSRGASNIDVTCTMFRSPTLDPLCWEILTGKKMFEGKRGIPGVNALVAASQNNYNKYPEYNANYNQKYFQKVGFKFEINHDLFNPNKCLDYADKIKYTMRIQVESDGKTGITAPINIFAHRISGDYADKIISHASPKEMNILIAAGWVRNKLTTTLDSRIPCNNTYCYFAAGTYDVIDEKFLGSIAGIPSIYKIYYYSTFASRIGSSNDFGPSELGKPGATLVWAPATWILPVPGPENLTTIPECKCDPEKENCEENDRTIDLECPQGKDKIIVPPSIYKIELSNNACEIGCTEKITVNLPPHPDKLKAGMGFTQDIEFKTEKFCSYEWRNKNSPDVKACNEWDVHNSYVYNNNLNKITPRLEFNVSDNKVSFGEFHKLNYGYEVERIPRQEPRFDRVYGGYIFTFKLPRVYIEKITGKKTFIKPPTDATHYDGGHKFYTKLDTPTGTYNYRITVTNLCDYNDKQTINYTCSFDVENEFPGPGDPDHYKGAAYIFRPISLEYPFPGRLPGSNWARVDWPKILSPTLNNNMVYSDSNLIYAITLDRMLIQRIRDYNFERKVHGGYLDISIDKAGNNIFFGRFGSNNIRRGSNWIRTFDLDNIDNGRGEDI